MVKRHPLLIGSLAAFAIGISVGYLIHPSPGASEAASANAAGGVISPDEHHPDDEAGIGRVRRTTRESEAPIPIRIDADGNFLLPPAMAERLQCIFLDGTKVDAKELRIFGLDDEQIGEIQKLIDEVFAGFFERQRATMREFTASENELIWEIRGNPQAAAEDKQWLIDRLQQICGAKAALISTRMIDQIGSSTVRLGERDYYLRVYFFRPDQDRNYLGFENIAIHPRPNQEPPERGDSFMDYEKRWTYESSGRNGGLVPPDTVMPLIHDRDWQRLLKRK